MYFKRKELEKFRSFKGPLIDVRSPSEYYKGHLPNSINIPLFDNDERSKIGTIYKKEGRKKAVIEGLKFFEKKMEALLDNLFMSIDSYKTTTKKNNNELLFYPWDEEPLTKDSEGILSPNNSFSLGYNQISMILVPCLSIDKNLIRLGYGGGYFDKLRKDNDWRNVPCIGVLTSNCVSTIPLTKAEWDIPLSGFITEKEIFV